MIIPNTSRPSGIATRNSTRVNPAEAWRRRGLIYVILHSISSNVKGHRPAAFQAAGRPFQIDVNLPHVIFVVGGQRQRGNRDGAGIYSSLRSVRGRRTIGGGKRVRHPAVRRDLVPIVK